MTATGPADNTFIIPDLVLGDSFKEWFDLTNNNLIDKLNRLKVYQTLGTTGITASVGTDGIASIGLDTIIPGNHTFTGNVTLNGALTTIDSFELNVQDYTLVLGNTGIGGLTNGLSNAQIETVFGGGGLILRGSSGDKEILWHNIPDAWVSSEHFVLNPGKGFGSTDNRIRFIETNTSGTSGGIQIGFVAGSDAINNDIMISHVDSNDISGITNEAVRIDSNGFVYTINGVNRKRIHQPSHGFTFGNVIRRDFLSDASLGGSGGYTLASAIDRGQAEVVGVISDIIDNNYFDITFCGEIKLGTGDSWSSSLVAGTTFSPGNAYFLSKDIPGKITPNPPVIPGSIRKVALVALGDDRALVTNYIGHEIPDETILTSTAFSNRKLVNQINNFIVGDIVRFDKTMTNGLTGPTDIVDTSIAYPNGTYQRASSDNMNLAEVVGIVSDTTVSGDPNKFFITTNGYFRIDSGITADGPGITSGELFYLLPGATGYGNVQITQTVPTTVGNVNKELFFSTSSTDGFFTNHLGSVIQPVAPSTMQSSRYIVPAEISTLTVAGGSADLLFNGATDLQVPPTESFSWITDFSTSGYIELNVGTYEIDASASLRTSYLNGSNFTNGNLLLTASTGPGSPTQVFGASPTGVSGGPLRSLVLGNDDISGKWAIQVVGGTADFYIKANLVGDSLLLEPGERMIHITKYN